MDRYRDRKQAGQILAQQLNQYKGNKDVIVLALPRGGVPVAFEIAKSLHAQLDVFVVRKIGLPGHEELAMGAIASGGVRVFNDHVIREMHVSPAVIDHVIAQETAELHRREEAYRDDRPFPDLNDKIVILVDDGIATGATLRAAIAGIKQLKPKKLIVAVPVADEALCEQFTAQVDEFVCPLRVSILQAVGMWYENFAQTEDEEVHACLRNI